MAEIRIQKLLSQAGICSRRQAEAWILDGRVQRNGRPVKPGEKATPSDVITVDGERVQLPKKPHLRYLMLNKPRGYVTTVSDDLGRKCVMDLLSGVEERVYPVGRLDRNTEGLLLFTNDGAFANAMMHPSRGISKMYRVTVKPPLTETALATLAAGIELDGKKTLPATVEVVAEEADRAVLRITIKEGRKRQIRRMCESVGLPVQRLKRTALGPLKLGDLKPGAWRDLTAEELRALRNAIGKEHSC